MWAVIDLMGHTRLAGEWSIEDGLVRLDNILNDPEHPTRYFGMQAIYAITPTDRAGAERAVAPWSPEKAHVCQDPVEWLADPEYDRLSWAIAKVREHGEVGPTHADEEEASELLAVLREIRARDLELPF